MPQGIASTLGQCNHNGGNIVAARRVYTSEEFEAGYARALSVWQSASPEAVLTGLSWYNVANEECRKAQLVTDLPLPVLAAAMSALSTQTSWERNLQAFWQHIEAYRQLCEGGRTVGDVPVSATLFRRSDSFAWAVLLGANPDLMGQGRKTRNFAQDILLRVGAARGIYDGDCTIDSLMCQVCCGFVPDKKSMKIDTVKYDMCRDIVGTLAALHNLTLYQAQAILWCAWKQDHQRAFTAASRANRRGWTAGA